MVLESREGSREVEVDSFWLGYRVINRKADELAVELRLPPAGDATASTHHRMTRVEHDLAKLAVSVRVDMHGETCKSARIAMSSVAPVTPAKTLKVLKQQGVQK